MQKTMSQSQHAARISQLKAENDQAYNIYNRHRSTVANDSKARLLHAQWMVAHDAWRAAVRAKDSAGQEFSQWMREVALAA